MTGEISDSPAPVWKLKGCPRCHGDLSLDRRIQPPAYRCLQCGYRHEFQEVVLPHVRRVDAAYAHRHY